MRFQDVYEFFENPPPIYLNKELAVCYVLAVLLRQDSYGTELIQQVTDDYPSHRLSDTVLYSALKFLEGQGAIDGYWQKVAGRGRPRRMYRLNADWRLQAEDLADRWQGYMNRTGDHPMDRASMGPAVERREGHELAPRPLAVSVAALSRP